MSHALVQLADLDLHRPHHLVHPVGLNEGVFDGWCLAFDHFGLERDALGKGIERYQALFRVLTEFLELRQGAELLLDILDCGHRDGGVLACDA